MLASFAPKPWILVVTFLGLALFTATAVIALTMIEPVPEDDWALGRRIGLWAAIVFCPAYAWDVWQRLRRKLPSLVATEEGLVLRSILGFTPTIPWSEIEAIGPMVLGKKAYMAVFLADPRRGLAEFGNWQRVMHVRSHAKREPNITLRGIQIGMDVAEAAKMLDEIRACAA